MLNPPRCTLPLALVKPPCNLRETAFVGLEHPPVTHGLTMSYAQRAGLLLCVPPKSSSVDLHLSVPPEPISDEEHELLQEWAAAASKSVTAYISRRPSDDPRLHGRIVISDRKSRKPLYLVYRTIGTESWTVASVVENSEIGALQTLRHALIFVRPVWRV